MTDLRYYYDLLGTECPLIEEEDAAKLADIISRQSVRQIEIIGELNYSLFSDLRGLLTDILTEKQYLHVSANYVYRLYGVENPYGIIRVPAIVIGVLWAGKNTGKTGIEMEILGQFSPANGKHKLEIVREKPKPLKITERVKPIIYDYLKGIIYSDKK